MPERRVPPDGVTIAIPNWNHEYFLARSVGSALRAVRDLRGRGVPADVLVVDDGSRDGSLPLLRQFEALYFDDGLCVLTLARNTGMAPLARNHALQAARYRYILFLDADDEIIPENTFHFYRAIKQTGAALVYGSLIRPTREMGQLTLFSNESYQHRIMDRNYIAATALVDQMQLLDVGGYTDSRDMLAREDWELYMHFAAVGRRIVFVPLVMGIYPEISGSNSDGTDETDFRHKQEAYIRRIYDQLGIRAQQPHNTLHLRYHPDIGYL